MATNRVAAVQAHERQQAHGPGRQLRRPVAVTAHEREAPPKRPRSAKPLPLSFKPFF